MTIGNPYSRDTGRFRSHCVTLADQSARPVRGQGILRWSVFRHNWLGVGIGEAGQARLAAARVLDVGAGGLGSPSSCT